LVLHDFITIWKHEAIDGFILLVGIVAIFVLTFSNDAWFPNGNAKKIDNKLGNLSYPLYLNHFAAEIGMYSLTNERSWSILFIAIILSLVISVMAFFITEPLTTRIRNAIRGQSLSQ
jgi:peptidoglycan/LPS O-acetylase OafA/YrhL